MDAYEKWFDKMEAERKQTEVEDAKNKLSDGTEEISNPSDKMEAERKQAEVEDAKNKLSDGTEEVATPSDKIQTEREQAEVEDAENKLSNRTREVSNLSDKIQGEITPPEKPDVKEIRTNEVEDRKERIVKIENKKQISKKRKKKTGSLLKYKAKLTSLIKSESKEKPSGNIEPEKKTNDQIKVFKFSKDVNTVKIIPDIWAKKVHLNNHVLVVDHNLDKKPFSDEVLIMVKETGIEYIIAPGFDEGFCKRATDTGLLLIECSDTKLLDEGTNIEVYQEEGVIFDADNGQEFKFKLLNESVRRRTLKKIRLGECLLIDDNLKLKVLDINNDQINICINGLKVVTLYQDESTAISDKIKITIFKIILDQFNIVIEAPEGTTI
ncbi:MAG: hypothetical protein GY777_10330, partial [Candidatus Brocadiaceae bacterium]|nr:hypothetical protein [Candidatus Brocadiaceae bacterium]